MHHCRFGDLSSRSLSSLRAGMRRPDHGLRAFQDMTVHEIDSYPVTLINAFDDASRRPPKRSAASSVIYAAGLNGVSSPCR